MSVPQNRRPITPGQVLREDYVEPLALKQDELATALGVHRTTINELLNDKRAVTPEMALRLGHAFNTSAEYWMNLQTAVDLYDALHSDARSEIEKLPVLVR
jgi:addiction module HigA family antidote